MKSFNAPGVFLQAPDDWFDASTYILAAPKFMGFTPTVVVNIVRQVLMPELQRHIDQQIYELQKLPGLQLVHRQDVTMTRNVQTGSITFVQDNNKQGPPLYQKQVYFMVGQTIWCLTATCRALDQAAVMPSLEAVIATFSAREWEPPNNA